MSARQVQDFFPEFSAVQRREELGFREGLSGGLMSRTMMQDEMASVLAQTAPEATVPEISRAIVDDNILGKPTLSSRRKSLAHLRELYGLDASRALFRVLRRLAALDPVSIPSLCLICVYCRDPQLRASFSLIRRLKVGEHLSRERMENAMAAVFPERFSPALRRSLAQNVNACWTASGHLRGRVKKLRAHPTPRPVPAAYAMLAGFLSGLRGQRLLYSEFGELVAAESAMMPGLLSLASARGLIGFKHAGGVVEFDFSALLTPREIALANVSD